MLGLFFSVAAGALMSIQGVFNTRLKENIGINETNLIVQGTAFSVALLIFIICGNGNLKNIAHVNKLFLFGGVIGVIITFTVIKGIEAMGATYAISTILVAQLIMAAIIDKYGLFYAEKVKFCTNEIIGVIAMVIGIIIFKLK